MSRYRQGVSFVLAFLPFMSGCAHSVHRPYPTIEQYSDGTNGVVSAFARALQQRDRTTLESLTADHYTLRPATSPAAPTFLSPSGMSVERMVPPPEAESAGSPETAPAVAAGSESSKTAIKGDLPRAEALAYLLARREAFIGILRNDARITGIQRIGPIRSISVHTTMHGLARGAVRMQEESWWRWELRLDDTRTGTWVIDKAVEERRTLVKAPQPIFTEVYPEEDTPGWKPGTKDADETRSIATPGVHDTGGVAILQDCVQGGACVLAAGGTGIAALTRGDPRDESPYSDEAKLLGLDGSFGEAKSLLTADLNNDGIPDLLVTYDNAPCRFYQGGRAMDPLPGGGRVEHLVFHDVTEGSGLDHLVGRYRTAVALDADRDGRLDLYLVQYGDSASSGPSRSGRNGLPNRFFRNVTEPGGPARFADESRAAGTDDRGWGLSAGAADFDGDGRPDLYVANDFGPNVMYRNVTPSGGPIRFQDVTAATGTTNRSFGMGVAWGDYDLDGDFDLYVSNYWFDERWIFSDPRFPLPPYPLRALFASATRKRLAEQVSGNSLYRNDVGSSGRFTRISDAAQTFDGGWSWGTVWSDVDGDMLPDLLVVNGMLNGKDGVRRDVDFWNEMSAGWKDFSAGRYTIDFGKDGITGPQAKRLFLNLGDGTFVDVAYSAGFDTTEDLRGLIAADVNGDGAPDLVAGGFLDSPVICYNLNGGLPTRVLVKLEGTVSNWDAVGAVVRLTASGRTQTRQVSAGGSFLSDGSRALEFALGESRQIDEIEVAWPSGLKTALQRPEPRAGILFITEPPREDSKP